MKVLDIMPIQLTQGLYALVDGKDFECLNQYKWCVHKRKFTYYAVRNTKVKNGKQRTILMHRQILGMLPGIMEIDHKNHNGLDNRKSNLRICTVTQNQHNQKLCNRIGTSQYKGVCWDKSNKKWLVSIQYNGKRINLGRFTNEIEAAKIYDQKAKNLFGEFAYTNF